MGLCSPTFTSLVFPILYSASMSSDPFEAPAHAAHAACFVFPGGVLKVIQFSKCIKTHGNL